MSKDSIEFKPRWREELVAKSARGTLVFELTMGTLHVYFPNEARWSEVTPQWARGLWNEYKDACQAWCTGERIPITLTGDAHVSEEK